MGFTVGNFFVCDKGLEQAGKTGTGVIDTNTHNCLPKDIDSCFLQVIKTKSGDSRTRAAKFVHPIVAVLDKDGYQHVYLSFQFTSSTNIASVNILNECSMFVEIRERGRGKNGKVLGQ